MSADRARRTSTGSTLRLVGQDAAAAREGDADTAPVEEGGVQSIVLQGQRQSVGQGRHWVVRTAAEDGVVGMANQVVELLASELLANAVLHGGEGGAVGVQVRTTETTVRVSVSDGGSLAPVVLHREPSAPSGRGMAIVEAMSTRWGVDEHAEGGKTVWFELDLDDF
ncbi:ATP-binding protein [Actinotalea ferrariae]|uniref:ATP-binding protein n=1 Tax=Actinotalea ferrariae TaxID=1386098 RepID=UPI001C8B9BFE|nr:ATP-binding protein [Actinotalea ferrariae]MBX9245419.1 ATP-binding protein [Actinotalea ferrariae]